MESITAWEADAAQYINGFCKGRMYTLAPPTMPFRKAVVYPLGGHGTRLRVLLVPSSLVRRSYHSPSARGGNSLIRTSSNPKASTSR